VADQSTNDLFDNLLKSEGEDFKRAVVECIKLLYNLHVRAQQNHNEDIKRISDAVQSISQSVTDTVEKLHAFDKKYNAIMKAVKGDNKIVH